MQHAAEDESIPQTVLSPCSWVRMRMALVRARHSRHLPIADCGLRIADSSSWLETFDVAELVQVTVKGGYLYPPNSACSRQPLLGRLVPRTRPNPAHRRASGAKISQKNLQRYRLNSNSPQIVVRTRMPPPTIVSDWRMPIWILAAFPLLPRWDRALQAHLSGWRIEPRGEP